MSRTYFKKDVQNLKNLENQIHQKQKYIQEKQKKQDDLRKLYQEPQHFQQAYKHQAEVWDSEQGIDMFSSYFQTQPFFEPPSGKQSIHKSKDTKKIQPGFKSKPEEEKVDQKDNQFDKIVSKLVKQKVNSFYSNLREQNKEIKNDAEHNEQITEDQVDNKSEECNKVQKKIKKSELLKSKISYNMVKLDLKKKYTERYRGQLYVNKTYYTKNGKLKNKWPKKENENKTISEGKEDFQDETLKGFKITNIYLQSISQGLLMGLYLDGNTELDEQMELQAQNTQLLLQQTWANIKQDFNNVDNLLLNLLKQIFNHNQFREGQLDSIKSMYKGQSVLMVQKTGFGKSLIYQFLSLLWPDGIGLIFCPLISLMIDQISKLPEQITAVAYHSMLTSFQRQKQLNMIKDGKIRLVFCTPELFQNDLAFVISNISKINFIVVDEAHCISELSQNFRPTYIVIDQLIKQFIKPQQPPYLALTATATQETIQNIIKKFDIKLSLINQTTVRENLVLTVSRDREVTSGLIKFLQKRKLSSVIIYARSRYMVESISNYLSSNGIKSKALHAGMTETDRLTIQEEFMKERIQIIVSTSVFAMGIDKSNVRAVIHINMPKSMESYIQEIGRAGRDGCTSYCHLFINENDYHMERGFVISDFPDKNTVIRILRLIQLRQQINDDQKYLKKDEIFQEDQNEGSLNLDYEQGKILQINSKECEKSIDLRKDTIFTVMRILENKSRGRIKIYPMCFEKAILRFFQKTKEEVSQENEYVKQILPLCKIKNGDVIVPIVKVSNILKINPLEVIRKCRNLYNSYSITCELKEEIIPFEFQLIEDEDQFLMEVFEQIEIYKTCALDKLNYMYLSMQENSFYSVDQISKEQVEIQRIHQGYKVLHDLYFNSQKPFKQLFEKLYPKQNNYQDDVQVDEILPFNIIDEQATKRIQGLINRFLREEVALESKPLDRERKLKPFVSDPKVLSKILCGIQSINYSYSEWKNNNLWASCKRYKYEQIYEVVSQYLVDRIGKKDI